MPVIASALVGFLLLAGAMGVSPQNVTTAFAAPLPAFSVRLTGYNAVSWQTDDTPLITASGATSNPEVVAARSRDLADVLPFGAVVAITGSSDAQGSCGFRAVSKLIGYRVIADTMNARMRDHIDVLFGNDTNVFLSGKSVNASRALGVCDNMTATVVGHIDVKDIPKTQGALAALVESGSARVAVAAQY